MYTHFVVFMLMLDVPCYMGIREIAMTMLGTAPDEHGPEIGSNMLPNAVDSRKFSHLIGIVD